MLLTKKMTTTLGALVVSALCLSTGAQAQTQTPYLGASWIEVNSESGIKLFGGANFNENFGWEASFSKIDDAKVLGGFAKGYLPFHPSFKAFGKLGINRLSGGGNSDTELGFGFGLLWAINQQISARVEYEDFGCSGDCDGISIGVKFSF
jgi:Outer membrane protein beta-barrel domain